MAGKRGGGCDRHGQGCGRRQILIRAVAPQPGTYRESMVRSCFHCPTLSAELEYNRMSPDSSPTNNIRLGGVSCAT